MYPASLLRVPTTKKAHPTHFFRASQQKKDLFLKKNVRKKKSPYARPNGRRPVPERPRDLPTPGRLGVDSAAGHVVLKHVKNLAFIRRRTI